MLAAAPAWFSENLVPIAGVTLSVLTVLILRMIQKASLRLLLLSLVALAGLLVYANRDQLQDCAQTCQCSLGGRAVTLPLCGRELDL